MPLSSRSFCVSMYSFSFVIQIKRNIAKLELYRKFTNALAASVLLSIAWIGFEVIPLLLLFSE